MQTPRQSAVATVLFGILWIVAVGGGLGMVLNYETRPGPKGAVPRFWPSRSKITRATDRPTLVMMAHPRCPCSRASVDELAHIMARVQGRLTAYVIFIRPEQRSDWENTELERSAAAIPGVSVLADVDGVEARQFGAETSGHTFLFDSDGRLLFSGGITQSRGHRGENVGESSITSLVNNQPAERVETFVFGCALQNPVSNDPRRCPK